MREYLELEFTAALADKQLSFTLDVERIIDDVVLFCMLVGNDFLPGGYTGEGVGWIEPCIMLHVIIQCSHGSQPLHVCAGVERIFDDVALFCMLVGMTSCQVGEDR